ncbi:MAG: hypothetical protein ACOVP4_10300 [Bacteriovoracaceae bacterium]
MFCKFFLVSLIVFTSLNSYAQLSGGFYGPEDCVKGEWQQREIVKSKEKINVHTYKALCKSRPNGEIIESRSTCVGEGTKVPTFADCMNEKKGIKHTNSSNGESFSPKFLELSKQLSEQSKPDKSKKPSGGGFYGAEDCVQGEWQQMEVSDKNEKHILHSFTSLCKSKPNGEVIVTQTECIGEGDKVPSLAECMKNSSSLVSKSSGNGDSFSQRYIEFSSEYQKQHQPQLSSSLDDCTKNDDEKSISCPDGIYTKSSSVVDSIRVSGKDVSSAEKQSKNKKSKASKQ